MTMTTSGIANSQALSLTLQSSDSTQAGASLLAAKTPVNPSISTARSQLNAEIVQASYDTAIGAANQPLALLLKTALTSINEALKPTLGDNAIQNAASEDNTPQGTADRIVSISTGFFAAYKNQHPDLSSADALQNFMATISSGFETGYKEASDLLQGLGVLNGTVASNIGKTYDLVQQGYAAFESAQSAAAPVAASDGAAGSANATAVSGSA